MLQYTSGSTGTPKGVMLTHAQPDAQLQHDHATASSPRRDGSGVFWLPTYHDMGLVGGMLQPMFIGRPSVLMSPMTFLQKPIRWLRGDLASTASRSAAGRTSPTTCACRRSPTSRWQGSTSARWELAFNGAEPVRAETLDDFAEKFGQVGFRREAFYPCYGMAETTLIVTGGKKTRTRRWSARSTASCSTRSTSSPSPPMQPVRATLVGCGRVLPDEES